MDAGAGSKPIEDYALLGDCRGSALVSRDGSIDWLCLPRFDSPAVFARLLGGEEHGTWTLRPRGRFRVARKYHENTMVLETRFSCADGEVLVEDALVVHSSTPLLLRSVKGIRGAVEMVTEIVLRPDYGSTIPWVRRTAYGFKAVAGPDEWNLQSPVRMEGSANLRSRASFEVRTGLRLEFALSWRSSHEGRFRPHANLRTQLMRTRKYWKEYAAQSRYEGPYKEAVLRSILTLKALTYEPTGGIVAAPTTSLPEHIGGERNWDYRYCWIRDSTFSFYALMVAGYGDDAKKWIDWLIKAVAGSPGQAHMLYGVAGEKRLVESELPWLPGYEGSRPVRVGNAAFDQFQMDVFGEVMDTLHLALINNIDVSDDAWRVQQCFLEFLEENWEQPDEGIWEVRGQKMHFTHSKVMAWVAVDRAIRNARELGISGPIAKWERLKQRMHQQICERGFSARRNAFVQAYDSDNLDASLLMIPMVGFLPPDDPRVVGTVSAIEKDLTRDRYVLRYDTEASDDGVGGGEGAFLACSFWLADNWMLMGRREEARDLFEHLLELRNDVGLLSEEYDPRRKRLVGNFPQAFSHIALINTAFNLLGEHGPVLDRREDARQAKEDHHA